MSDTKYYYSDASNKSVGPVTLEQLRQLAHDHVIDNETNVIVEGSTDWVRYGDVVAGEQTSEMAAKIAQQARSVGVALGRFKWGAFLSGFLFALLQTLDLPYVLLKKAVTTLSDWGQSRMLPSAQSDVPVLTFLTVVMRPVVHVVYTVWALYKDFRFLFTGEISLAFIPINFAESVGERIGYFLLILLAVYFFNIAIGFVFDVWSVIVGIANSVKNIERRK
jgi:GYF domain 2